MAANTDPNVISTRLQVEHRQAIDRLKAFEAQIKKTGSVVEIEARKIRNALKGISVPRIALPVAGAGGGGRSGGGFSAGSRFIGPLFPRGEAARIRDANTQLKNLAANTNKAAKAAKAHGVAVGVTTSSLLKMGLAIQVFRVAARVTREATEAGAQYSLRLAEIATLTDEVTFSTAAQREIIDDVSEAYGERLLVTAPALYDAISAGATNAAEANEILSNSIKLAIGTISSQQTATSLLIGVLNAYGDEVAGAAAVTDDFFAIVRQGKLRLEELDPSLGRVTSLAKAAGLSFKELGASIVALTRSGSSASEALTKIRSILNASIKKQGDFDKAFQKIGLRFDSTTIKSLGFIKTLQTLDRALDGNVDQLGKVFGRVEALAGFLSLTSDEARLFSEGMEGMSNSAGRADQAMVELRSSGGRAFEELKNVTSNFFTRFGEDISDAIGGLARFLKIVGDPGGRTSRLDKIIKDSFEAARAFGGLSKDALLLNASLNDLGKIDLAELLSASEDFKKIGLNLTGTGGQVEISAFKLSSKATASFLSEISELSDKAGEIAALQFMESRAEAIGEHPELDPRSLSFQEDFFTRGANLAAKEAASDLVEVYRTALADGLTPLAAELADGRSVILKGITRNLSGAFDFITEEVDTSKLKFRALQIQSEIQAAIFAESEKFRIPFSDDPFEFATPAFLRFAEEFIESVEKSLDPTVLRDIFSLQDVGGGEFALDVRGALSDTERFVTINKELVNVGETLAKQGLDEKDLDQLRLTIASKIRQQVIDEAKDRDVLLNKQKDRLKLEERRASIVGDKDLSRELKAQIASLQEVIRLQKSALDILEQFSAAAVGGTKAEAELARQLADVVDETALVLDTNRLRKESVDKLLSSERLLADIRDVTESVDLIAERANLQAALTGSIEDQVAAIEATRVADLAANAASILANKDRKAGLEALIPIIDAIADARKKDLAVENFRKELEIRNETKDIQIEILELLGKEEEAEKQATLAGIDARVQGNQLLIEFGQLTESQTALIKVQIVELLNLRRIAIVAAGGFWGGFLRGVHDASAAVESFDALGRSAAQGMVSSIGQMINVLGDGEDSWKAIQEIALKTIGNIITEMLILIALQNASNSGSASGATSTAISAALNSGFARGGVMQGEMLGSGSLPTNMYAHGGIADSPQLAVFGEGRGAEAFVPLPDGRSIPVSLNLSGIGELQQNMRNIIRQVEMAHATQLSSAAPVVNNITNEIVEVHLSIPVDARGAEDPASLEAAVDRAIDKSIPRIADAIGSGLSRGSSAKLVRGVRDAGRGRRG